MFINPLHSCDFYKVSHKDMYPEGTNLVFSNFTPRSTRLAPTVDSVTDNRVVFFGLQGFIQWFLIEVFEDGFFDQPKDLVVSSYKRRMDNALGPDSVDVSHIEALHDLGYLPIEIMALPEGSKVNPGVPLFTVRNTQKDFYWLVNYLETVISNAVWKPSTTATIAYKYRQILEKYATMTGTPIEIVGIQGHDFSCRGMSGPYDAQMSGAGHLVYFEGTDTISAIDYLEEYYFANSDEELVGCSVPATEHSVMCMGGKETEIETFRRLIRQYPSGILSIVSDTWDFWKVITEYATELKDEIEARTPNALGLAKVVFRPDSGDPVKILTGYTKDEVEFFYNVRSNEPTEIKCKETGKILTPEEYKGAVEVLFDVFGGNDNAAGFTELNERVGLIYGDSITLERCEQICQRLADKGFASGNVVFGIGSFTYQYNTRDTLGFAMKATYGEINGEAVSIFKDPVTDSGVKKSARGLLQVVKGEDGEYVLNQDATWDDIYSDENAMRTVFFEGDTPVLQTLSEIRNLARS